MNILSLINGTRDTGECIVKIAGAEISEFYPSLKQTAVNLKRKGSAEAVLTFSVLRDGERWPMDSSDRIRAWAQIEIIVVFGEIEEPFFSGYIKEISTDVGDNGNVGTITLTCQDIFSAMDRHCQKVTWDAGRDGLEIISDIIRPYGLTLETNLQSLPVDNSHQNMTDFRFIRELANKNNLEWYLRDQPGGIRILHFGNINTSSDSSFPKLMVSAGRSTNCLSFNVTFDGYKPDGVRFSTQPVDSNDVNISTTQPDINLFGNTSSDSSSSGLDAFEWCLPPENNTSEQSAEQAAQSEANENSFKLKATGKLDGTAYGALLLPGEVVEVGGTGENDGKWYLDKTNHLFNASGYFIEFELIRNGSAGNEISTEHILAGVL